jgi:hypothetical protein
MIFTTKAEWEIKNPILKALGEDESVRTYPFIEISLNVPLFHVDIRFPYDGDEEITGCRRFIMHDIEHVKQLIKQDGVIGYDIYLETPRDINKNSVERHKVKRLSKIIQGKDEHNCITEAYIFTDGDCYIEGETESIDEINNATVIFDSDAIKREG